MSHFSYSRRTRELQPLSAIWVLAVSIQIRGGGDLDGIEDVAKSLASHDRHSLATMNNHERQR
jgi:hypothetical protein